MTQFTLSWVESAVAPTEGRESSMDEVFGGGRILLPPGGVRRCRSADSQSSYLRIEERELEAGGLN